MLQTRAAEFGVTNTIRHFQKKIAEREQALFALYKKRLAQALSRGEKPENVKKLPSERRGRPLLLGKELDSYVQNYIKSLGEAGAVVNSAITIAQCC